MADKIEKYLLEKPERSVCPTALLEKLVLKKDKGVDVVEEVIDWFIEELKELKSNKEPEPEPEN